MISPVSFLENLRLSSPIRMKSGLEKQSLHGQGYCPVRIRVGNLFRANRGGGKNLIEDKRGAEAVSRGGVVV